ncbi:MAG TPA: bifunctional 4-hydroxy-2-oxoglutarate aldolase/2-dehydro-3-deoxy-phosphogluconate aldolase [Terriglobia bacterium]|nr:bifunctional 4-hydroxy-2-oxoglutarate aldolase/2-dehydro-3-deoxy-phosphogluconate aldolase [Terriglobia bacterium]
MSWTKEKAVARISEIGLIPIVRTPSSEAAFRAAEAILSGGIGIAEITMTVPDAFKVMERVVKSFGDQVLLGAGTVLDAKTCEAALAAGAEFIVTPSLELDVIQTAKRHNKACIIGALSPTEVLAAWRAGASMVKIFPCGPVGGPNYIKALKGPFPNIDYVPTGGVTLETTPDFIRAGAAAVAVGGELVDVKALQAGNVDAIIAKARKFLEAVRAGREAH